MRTAHQPRRQSAPVGTTEQGIASWYGAPYDGRPAADGEIFHTEQMVAAHRTLPFNTWLKVTNLNNGRTVNVRVIDRGPFTQGRILDLSKAAARQIEMLGPGTARIRLEVISSPAESPTSDYYGVQAGAFSNFANARRLQAKYAARYGSATVEVKQGSVPLYRVLVGNEPSIAACGRIASELQAEIGPVFIVRLDPRNQTGAPVPSAAKASEKSVQP